MGRPVANGSFYSSFQNQILKGQLMDILEFAQHEDVAKAIVEEISACKINKRLVQLYLSKLNSESASFSAFRNILKLCIAIKYERKRLILQDEGFTEEELNVLDAEVGQFKASLDENSPYMEVTSQVSEGALTSININQGKVIADSKFKPFMHSLLSVLNAILNDSDLTVEKARNLYLEKLSDHVLPTHINANTLGAIFYTVKPDAFPLTNDYVIDKLKQIVGKYDKTPSSYIHVSRTLDTIRAQLSPSENHFGAIDRVFAMSKGLTGNDSIEVTQIDEVVSRESVTSNFINKSPLNQILFGAAGTGKTYHTINKALEIINPMFLKDNEDDRESLKKHFDDLLLEKRIRFVTFHQSFSYEDFIEGIRASNSDDTGQLTYKVEDGIFKEICKDANRQILTDKSLGINDSPRIWKISIGDDSSRAYCFKNGEARIGWGEAGDLRLEESRNSEYFKSLGSNDRNTLGAFAEEMQVGDIIVCLKSVSEISAVGIIGEYFFDADSPTGVRSDYLNGRKVKWLFSNLSFNIRNLNSNNGLTLKTVYELSRFSWTELESALAKEGFSVEVENINDDKLPYVLIIDEINRGNISRVFGELITLIEEGKRAGQNEALSVMLPYSNKSFSVPENVYIIGTMNSSDRSLTGIDIALRRRFTFIEKQPDPTKLNNIVIAKEINIQKLLEVMNQRIEVLLDRDHCIGHAYFMSLTGDSELSDLAQIFKQKILPLLQEYFFDDWERIDWVFNQNGFISKSNYDLHKLFSSEVASKLKSHCWKINDTKGADAFLDKNKYLQILNGFEAVVMDSDNSGETE